MKLFRKFRQALIFKGNLRKYLFYAIGEILLVMIGILLALQVNNLNNDRLQRKAAIQAYQNIKDQILDDKKSINGQIDYNSYYMKRFATANNIIKTNDRMQIDTLGAIAIELTNYSDYDRQGNIYETLVNSGEIKLLKNQDILEGLRDLERQYLYLNRMEAIHYDTVIGFVIPALGDTVKWSDNQVQKPNEVFSFKFQNLILALLRIMSEKDLVYKGTIDQIDKVNTLIDNELELISSG